MKALLAFTAVAFLASLAADRRKTALGVKKGLKMFLGILPTLFGILSLVSLMLAAFHPSAIRQMLGDGGTIPFIAALLIGSISLIPGFIAFPLAGVLRQNGANYEYKFVVDGEWMLSIRHSTKRNTLGGWNSVLEFKWN